MNKILSIVAVVFLTSLFCCCNREGNDSELKFKIAQMLVVGFKGSEADERLLDLVSQQGVGGVILFSQDVSEGLAERNVINMEQLTGLTRTLQEASDNRLLISIDQEGGAVQRLRADRGFVETPSPQYLGEVDDLDSTRHYSAISAEQLVELGINVNFVPCVDLNLNPENPVIGARGRAISDDRDVVVRHAEVVIEEFDKRGIITSLKHFPGHGSSVSDSHLGFTDITDSFSSSELEPYRQLIEEDRARIVMVGHLFNRNIDSLYPASLSRVTIDSILRCELRYDGVVATDDMNMRAITDHYTYKKALQLAINAGVDMVIIGNNGAKYESDLPERSMKYIYEMVKDGTIPQSRIDEAYKRITALKDRVLP
ncbi:MAG: glycoside hydrolase family 3 N-terminal domain-containing protein [Rikenellaceae bacterium]